MRTRQRAMMIFAPLVLAFAGIAGTLAFVDRDDEDPGQLAQAQQPGEDRGITVDGEGQISVEPDMARVVLGIEIDGQEIDALREEANSRMDAVIQALQDAGIDENDIQTRAYNISVREKEPPRPQEDAPDAEQSTSGAESDDETGEASGSDGESTETESTETAEEDAVAGETEATDEVPAVEEEGDRQITGYRITQLVEVTVRDIDATGDIIDTGLDAGANHVSGIRFEVDDREEAVEQARERAVEDARQKAEHLAELTGVSLGAPLYIDERSPSGPPERLEEVAMEADDAATAGSAPIQPGESVITVNVNIIYGIE